MMRRSLVFGFLAVISLLAAPTPSRADDILEDGPDDFVIAMYPNAGGAVVLHVGLNPRHITTTIVDVWAAPGWSYGTTRAGGVDSLVEIRYESALYRSRFSSLIKPGKTVIDYGEIKKR
jgi:hypothetical protein